MNFLKKSVKIAGELIKERNLKKVESGVVFCHKELRGKDLSKHNLCGKDFSNADMTDAKFNGSKLDNSYFSQTVMSNADMSNVRMVGAQFDKAKTKGIKLAGSNLTNAIFYQKLRRKPPLLKWWDEYVLVITDVMTPMTA